MKILFETKTEVCCLWYTMDQIAEHLIIIMSSELQ